ncbi:acyltransferase [Selenomonas sputigena]|nr:acyltransferase [Selenomonas sputigena]
MGFGHVGIFDARYSRSIWEVKGEIEFQGEVRLGHGTRISVGEKGTLVFSAGVDITAETAIVCQRKISFGEGTLISWDNLIMDTDFHHVIKNDEIINPPAEIHIGKHVWIGCRCTILKGSVIADKTIVAAGSLIAKKFTRGNVIIGGISAKVLTDEVEWMA